MPTLTQRYARHLRHLWVQGHATIDPHLQTHIALAFARRIMEDRWCGRVSLVATLRSVAQFEARYGAQAMGFPWRWQNARGKALMSEQEALYALAHIPDAPASWKTALSSPRTHP